MGTAQKPWFGCRPIASETGLFVSFWPASAPANIKHRRRRAAFGARDEAQTRWGGMDTYRVRLRRIMPNEASRRGRAWLGSLRSSSYSSQVARSNRINQSITLNPAVSLSVNHSQRSPFTWQQQHPPNPPTTNTSTPPPAPSIAARILPKYHVAVMIPTQSPHPPSPPQGPTH